MKPQIPNEQPQNEPDVYIIIEDTNPDRLASQASQKNAQQGYVPRELHVVCKSSAMGASTLHYILEMVRPVVMAQVQKSFRLVPGNAQVGGIVSGSVQVARVTDSNPSEEQILSQLLKLSPDPDPETQKVMVRLIGGLKNNPQFRDWYLGFLTDAMNDFSVPVQPGTPSVEDLNRLVREEGSDNDG